MWAAFKTVTALSEPTPEHDLAFPFDHRWGSKHWRAAFLREPQTAPVEGKVALWKRGRELVGGASHGGACHT